LKSRGTLLRRAVELRALMLKDCLVTQKIFLDCLKFRAEYRLAFNSSRVDGYEDDFASLNRIVRPYSVCFSKHSRLTVVLYCEAW